MTRAQRNNNPVNLRYAGQTEATGRDGDGFAVFLTPEAGWRAAHAQIDLDRGRNLTVKQFLHKFAPASENDTANYLKFVCLEMNCSPDEFLANLSRFALAGVMARMEGYYNK
jgi:hypothetical protein